jgi:hypothetical protein
MSRVVLEPITGRREVLYELESPKRGADGMPHGITVYVVEDSALADRPLGRLLSVEVTDSLEITFEDAERKIGEHGQSKCSTSERVKKTFFGKSKKDSLLSSGDSERKGISQLHESTDVTPFNKVISK